MNAATLIGPKVASVEDIVLNGVRLRVEEEGSGSEAVVFSHGLMRDRRMFDAQVAALSDRYRCVRYDHRGQGESEAPRAATIDLETVYEDSVALIETLGLAPCHWVGLSMGGMVGMRLAARRPDLVRSLVLLDTTAESDSRGTVIQNRILLGVRTLLGPRLAAKLVLPAVMRLLYGPTFRHDSRRRSERLAERADVVVKIKTTSPAVVWGVVKRSPIVDELSQIGVPTLVLVGDEDTPIPPRKAERLAGAIPDARFQVIAGAGHSAPVEQPRAVTALIAGFLAQLPS